MPEWYYTAIQTAMDGFFIDDFNGNILDVNDSYCKMTGYSREELLTMNVQEIDVGYIDSFGTIQTMHTWMRGEGAVKADVRQRHKNGKLMDMALSVKYLDVGIGLFFCFQRDVTEEKKAFQQLIESEDRYRSLVELGAKIGEAIIMIQDINGRSGIHTFVNEKWPRITGYTKKELLSMSFFDLVSKKDYKTLQEKFRQKTAEGLVTQLFELDIIRKDGGRMPIEITGAVTTYKGKPANVIYIRDITHRKQTEEKLRQYKDHLEALVRERTSELTAANEQLKQEINKRKKAEEKANKLYQQEKELRRVIEKQIEQRIDFTRSLAHEMKTPISPMLGATELLSINLKEEPWSKLAKQAYRGAQDLNKRLDDFFDLTRGELGILRLEFAYIEPCKIVKDVFEYSSTQAKSSAHNFKLDIPESLPLIWCDPQRLRQVLLNLLDNAFKHTPRGTDVTLKASKRGRFIYIEVIDTGEGIPNDKLKYIFSPYHLNIKDRDCFSGLGLGFSLCNMYMKYLGGSIKIDNKFQEGCRVVLRLPVNGHIPQVKGKA